MGLKLGYADIHFNTRSGDLLGPPGTTPAGVQASVQDSRTLALVGELPLSAGRAAVVQLGVPPVVRFNGAGAGAALGEVGSARAWFPAVLLGWKPQPWGAVQPYLAAGVNATFFTDTAITPAYTAAFAGSASRSSLKRSFGPVFKLGAELSQELQVGMKCMCQRCRAASHVLIFGWLRVAWLSAMQWMSNSAGTALSSRAGRTGTRAPRLLPLPGDSP